MELPQASTRDELNCPTCLCELILPVSLQCGHNICLACAEKLEKPTCPCCRASISELFKVNKMLESFLREKIEGYDELAKERSSDALKNQSLKHYHGSTRYHNFAENIDALLGAEGIASLSTLFKLCQQLNLEPEPTLEEIRHVCAVEDFPVITLVDEFELKVDYACAPLTAGHLKKIFAKTKSSSTKERLPWEAMVSLLVSYDEELGEILIDAGYLTKSNTGAGVVPDSFITFLQSIEPTLVPAPDEDDEDNVIYISSSAPSAN